MKLEATVGSGGTFWASTETMNLAVGAGSARELALDIRDWIFDFRY